MTLCVLSAGSTLHGIRACLALMADTVGEAIEIFTDHGHTIRDALQRGGPDASKPIADVVLLPAEMIAALAERHVIGHQVALGTVGIGGVVREGSPALDISTMEKLRTALIAAEAVLLTSAPTGEHMRSVIAKLGLADDVSPKLHRLDTSTGLNIDLAGRSGNALGFGPETEIRAGAGVRWIGDVPDEIQIALPYAAAMVTGTQNAAAAHTLLAFLATAPAHDVFAKTGVKF